MSPRVECNGVMRARCNLEFLGSSDCPTPASPSSWYKCMPPCRATFLVFFCFVVVVFVFVYRHGLAVLLKLVLISWAQHILLGLLSRWGYRRQPPYLIIGFYFLNFSVCVSLGLIWVFCGQHVVGSCWLSQSLPSECRVKYLHLKYYWWRRPYHCVSVTYYLYFL